jgi:hypothetical protein
MMGELAITLRSSWVSWSPIPPTVAKYLRTVEVEEEVWVVFLFSGCASVPATAMFCDGGITQCPTELVLISVRRHPSRESVPPTLPAAAAWSKPWRFNLFMPTVCWFGISTSYHEGKYGQLDVRGPPGPYI